MQKHPDIEILKQLMDSLIALNKLSQDTESLKESRSSLEKNICASIDRLAEKINPRAIHTNFPDVKLGNTLYDMTKNKEGGDLLKCLLDEFRITSKDFAQDVGITNKTYFSGMLNNKRPISRKNAVKFVEWFEKKGLILKPEKFFTKKEIEKRVVDVTELISTFDGWTLVNKLLEALEYDINTLAKDLRITDADLKSEISEDLAGNIARWFENRKYYVPIYRILGQDWNKPIK